MMNIVNWLLSNSSCYLIIKIRPHSTPDSTSSNYAMITTNAEPAVLNGLCAEVVGTVNSWVKLNWRKIGPATHFSGCHVITSSYHHHLYHKGFWFSM